MWRFDRDQSSPPPLFLLFDALHAFYSHPSAAVQCPYAVPSSFIYAFLCIPLAWPACSVALLVRPGLWLRDHDGRARSGEREFGVKKQRKVPPRPSVGDAVRWV
eukprot:RCo006593